MEVKCAGKREREREITEPAAAADRRSTIIIFFLVSRGGGAAPSRHALCLPFPSRREKQIEIVPSPGLKEKQKKAPTTKAEHSSSPLFFHFPTLASTAAFAAFLGCTGNLPPFFFLRAHSPRLLYVFDRPAAERPGRTSLTLPMTMRGKEKREKKNECEEEKKRERRVKAKSEARKVGSIFSERRDIVALHSFFFFFRSRSLLAIERETEASLFLDDIV